MAASGAYAEGYLGGYKTLVTPSRLDVVKGLTTLNLNSYISTWKVFTIAISFKIIPTAMVWFNLSIAIFLTFIM